MNLNEDTYSYIHRVADQIEGLTCALIVFIENAGSYLESYHYEAFNKFSNEIRNMEISVSKEIKNEFLGVKETIEESALQIRASDNSVSYLKSKLSETEEVFSRLVIHCQNIREINSDTSNPYVPNASDEVYRAFSGYNTLLNQYQVNASDENDYICTLMYSFYCTVKGLFEQLFSEYDTMLQEFGVDVEEKKKRLAALTVIKKREGRNEILKASIGFAKTAAFAKLGIKKKNVFDVVESGIALIAKISDTLDELDELKFAKPKKSVARKVIKKIAAYNDALELVSGANGAGSAIVKKMDIDFEVPTFARLIIAIPLACSKKLEKTKKSGTLDVVTSSLNTIESGMNFGNTVLLGKGAASVIQKIPDLGSNALGLFDKTAELFEKSYEKNINYEDANKILNKLGKQLNDYNKEVEEYKINKERKLLATKRPKAPPYIVASGVFDRIKDGMDYSKEGVEIFEGFREIL